MNPSTVLFTRKHLPHEGILSKLSSAGLKYVHGTLQNPGIDPREVLILMPGLEPVSREALDEFPHLRLIALSSTGFDSVDLHAAEERGIHVTHVPHQATEEVATHALALILALLRNIPMYDRNVRSGNWQSPRGIVTPHRASSLTLGIVGLGRIGSTLATYTQPIFKRVIAFDPYMVPGADTAVDVVHSFAELMDSADVLSLHVPRTPETERLLEQIDFTNSPTRYVVNVSRGGLISHTKLLAALNAHHLDGVALDAYDPEPPHPDDPLLQHPRVISTPHRAFESIESWQAYASYPVENAVAYMRDEPLISPIPVEAMGQTS